MCVRSAVAASPPLSARYYENMEQSEPKYYTAYEERYKTVHEKGFRWSSRESTPIVMATLEKYGVIPTGNLLEIGCGEGRDARAVLDAGYDLLATDVSEEAITYCRKNVPLYADRFSTLDCLTAALEQRFDCIYAVAVIHMLVLDEDRDGFYRFIRNHLKPDGIALVCSMGDGETEFQTDISTAFTLQRRDHESGPMMVAGTSCRMVSCGTFENELRRNGFSILESGLTSAPPDFDSLLFAVVKRG